MPVETVVVGFGNMGFAFLWARESDVGIIETSHVISESIGSGSVVDVLKEKIPDVPVDFLPVQFPYDWV